MLGITFEETRVYQEIRQEALQDGREAGLQEGRQEGRREGRQEGRQEEAATLVLRLLKKRFGHLPEDIITSVSELPLPALEELSEALLDFLNVTELQDWLASHFS